MAEHTNATITAKVDGLSVTFRRSGKQIHAIRDVSLSIGRGEIVAVVGESGSGKSVLALSLLGLLPHEVPPVIAGSVLVDNTDMIHAPEADRRRVRREFLGALFQDPMSSLNPTMKIGPQIMEVSGSAAAARDLLELVRVPDAASRMNAYPHELSGGLRQRVMLAIAVAGSPRFVIADEPTTALDVTIQAQVLDLIKDLRSELGCSFLLITHDLGVAAQVADRVEVMYAGRIVESGPMLDVLTAPAMPYTAGLLQCRLDLDLPRDTEIATLAGQPPDPAAPLPGCSFEPRCRYRVAECQSVLPVLAQTPKHPGSAACLVAPQELQGIRGERLASPLPPPAETDSGVILRYDGVFKGFRLRQGLMKRTHREVLSDINLEVARGECLALVGESGSGKSTALRLATGLLRPDTGVVERLGGPPQMIYQDAGASLTPWMTVGQLLDERIQLAAKGNDRDHRRAMIADCLRGVGLPQEVAGAKAAALSGGQRQRVAFARATIVPPDLLLCDEPTSALDASLAGQVLNLLQTLRRRLGMAVLFVTHDLAAARLIGDRIAVISAGRIVEVGPAEEVIANPSDDYTRQLLRAIPTIKVAGPQHGTSKGAAL
jgi:peptide/nickel transport system ATP-binding protein